MAKSKRPVPEVGGELTYRFDIVRVEGDKVTVAFKYGVRHTISVDDENILDVFPMPKIGGNRKLSEPD